MAEREAAIKLTLDDGQFVAGMGKAGDAAVKSAQRSEKAMQVFGAGVKKATSNLSAMGSTARSSLGLVSGLLGGLTFGSALKGAVELDSKFKQLAFRVSIANKEQVKAATIQKLVEQAAIKTGRRTAEMADVFADLFQATGDSKFTADMLETIGVAATATGADVKTLTALADQLHTKFGVAAADMGDMFATMASFEQGGNSMAEMGDIVGRVGAELLNAGLTGRRGLGFMIGALAATEDLAGGLQSQVKGIKQVLLSLGDQNQIKALAKNLHIDPKKLLNEKDLIGRLKRVLGMGKKGIDALKGSMTEAEEQKALKYIFLDPFEAALKRAQDAGLKGKAATDKALADLEAHIEGFGKAALTGADMVREANERRKDPERLLAAALDTLQRSFGDPAIIAAIEDLAKYLPQIAEAFGKFAKFVIKNPVLSGTLAVGGKAGMGFLEGAIGEAIRDALTGGGSGHGSAGGGSAGGGGRAGSRIERHHQFLGEGISEAQMLENTIEDGIERGGKAGASKLATAIRIAGIAAMAELVYAIGTEQIDNAFKGKADASGNAAVVGAQTGSMRGGLAKQQADAEALRAAIAQLRQEQGGFVSTLFGSMAHGAGAQVDEMGNPTGVIDAGASGAPDLEGTLAKQMAELEQQLQAKEALIAKLEASPAPGEAGTSGAPVDGKTVGKAVADTLKQGAPLTVHVANMPQGGPGTGKAGPGGSRGPKRPAAHASGSGL